MMKGIPRVALKAWGVLLIGGLLGLFVNGMVLANDYCPDTGAGSCPVGDYTWVQDRGGYSDVTMVVKGFAPDEASAIAMSGFQDYLINYMAAWDEETWDGTQWLGVWCHGCDGDNTHLYIYVYDDGTGCGVHECIGGTFPEGGGTGDSDNDGIPDEYDPYPNDPDPFSWQFIKGVRDPETGFWKAYCIRTDRGDNFCFGDMDYWQNCIDALYVGCELEVFQEGEYNYEGEEITDYLLGLASEFTPPVTVARFKDGERVVTPSSGIQSGTTYIGTETESESLGKIIDNTSNIASNQQTIANYLKGIDQGIAGLQEGLSNIDNTDVNVNVGDYNGPSASDIATAIDDMEQSHTQETVNYANNNINSVEEPEFNAEFEPGDIPDKNGITGIFDSFIGSNPVTNALENSGVNLINPICAVEVNLPIGSFYLDMCDYEDALEIWGGILIGVTSLISLILVVKR